MPCMKKFKQNQITMKFAANCIALGVAAIFIAASHSLAMLPNNPIAPAAHGPIAVGGSSSLHSVHNAGAPTLQHSFVPVFGMDENYKKFLEKQLETMDGEYGEFVRGQIREEQENEAKEAKEEANNQKLTEKHPRKLLTQKHKKGEENANEKEKSKGKEKGRELLGTLNPVSYQTKVIVENRCDFTVMPAIRSTDKRYHELDNRKALYNLANGQQLSMEVPYDIHGMEIWPRKNCRADGSGCESGGCPGKNGNYVNCFGTEPIISPLTTVTMSLREGKNVYNGHDFYKAVPLAASKNVHVKVIPTSKPSCPTLDVRGEVHHAECDNTQDLKEHTYTVSFCPL